MRIDDDSFQYLNWRLAANFRTQIHRILNGEKTTEDPSAYIEGASSSLVAALDLGVHDGWTWVKVDRLSHRPCTDVVQLNSQCTPAPCTPL